VLEGEGGGTHIWFLLQQLTLSKYILKLYFINFQVLRGTRFDFLLTECTRLLFMARFNVSGSAISLTASLKEKKKHSSINVNSVSMFWSCNDKQWNDRNFGRYTVRGYLELISMHWLNGKQQKINEKCILRTFTSRSPSPNIRGSIKDDNIGRACGTCIGG